MALDLSLSGAGVTIVDQSGKILHQELLSSVKKRTKKHKDLTQLVIYDSSLNKVSEEFIPTSNLLDMQRIAFYEKRIKLLCSQYKVTDVMIEGYSYSSTGSSGIDLGQLGGVIRYSLYELKIPYIQSPPHNVKAFITGFAWASKERIQDAVLEKYGITIIDDNLADSFVMAQMRIELGSEVMTYCQKGGVELLKLRKAEEYRKKYQNDPLLVWKKNLDLGMASEQDLEGAIKFLKHKNLDLLGIDQSLLEKKKMKKINEKYKLKKPKKENPKKSVTEPSED